MVLLTIVTGANLNQPSYLGGLTLYYLHFITIFGESTSIQLFLWRKQNNDATATSPKSPYYQSNLTFPNTKVYLVFRGIHIHPINTYFHPKHPHNSYSIFGSLGFVKKILVLNRKPKISPRFRGLQTQGSFLGVSARLVDGKFQKATFFDEANVEAKALRTSVRNVTALARGMGCPWWSRGTTWCVENSMNIMDKTW